MRNAIIFYGLDVEIRPEMDLQNDPWELFIHLGGAIGTAAFVFGSSIMLPLYPWMKPKLTTPGFSL